MKSNRVQTILLYVCPMAINSIVPKTIYKHFLLLNNTMTIFLSPNYYHLAQFAKLFMNDFVKEFGFINGEYFISHNIHALIHLHEDNENLLIV